MKKKLMLFLLTFLPVPAGYLINLLSVSGHRNLFSFSYFVLPLIVLVLWFMLGSSFSKIYGSFPVSLMTSSLSGLLSLVLYFWQFKVCSDETRNIFLAVLSQGYLCSTPMYLSRRIASLFVSSPEIDTAEVYIASVVMMAAVFSLGFIFGNRSQNKKEEII